MSLAHDMSGGISKMKCPLLGRQGCLHAVECQDVTEGRSGAGDEGTGSDLASDGEEDHLVAGSRDSCHHRP